MRAATAPTTPLNRSSAHPGGRAQAEGGRGARLTRVFRCGLLVIVIHVLDSGLVHPEPGVARADHVSAVLVPIAAALLAGWVLPRLRPMWQAALVLTTGLLAVTEGGLELAHVVVAGMSGDDLTGLLVLATGAVMLLVGGAHLWSRRDRRGRRAQMFARRAGWSLAAGLVAYFVVGPLAWGLAVVNLPRQPVPAADLGHLVEEVHLESADGVRLTARYVPSRNGAAVIVSPSSSTAHARLLTAAGYGVLLVDNRGEGGSAGDPNGLGWEAALDYEAGLDFLLARPDVNAGRIGALGLSVGGEGLLEVAATRPELAAVVSEGAGIRSWAEAREGSLVEKAIWGPLTLAAVVTSGELPPASLQSLLPQIAPRSVLLIHAEHGQAGEHLNPRYAELLGPHGQLWSVPEGRHMGGLREHPAEYERRVVGFFDEVLAP